MRVFDVLNLLRLAGPSGTWALATHAARLRRINRLCLIVTGLTALEKRGLNEELLSAGGLDLRRHDDLDRHTLGALLEYLYEVAVLDEVVPGVYRAHNRRRFRRLLRVMYGYYAYHEPVQMLDKLITGECAYGRDVARDDRYDAMASADLTSHFSYPFSANLLDGRPFRTLVDMGSGTGRYCVFMADRFPEARFYGVDLSERAVNEGRAQGHESDRVRLRTGDMTKLESIDLGHGGVDVFSFMFVLHEFRDAMVRSILRSIRETHPAATVLLTELTAKPSHAVRKQRRSLFPELKLVHELSDQIIRTPDRWKELFAGAGFCLLADRSNALTDHVAMLFATAA